MTTQDVIFNMETKNAVIDKRRKSRKTGGYVNMWPKGIKRWGPLPKGDKVKKHLQTGPGGSYVLQRQTQLQLPRQKHYVGRGLALRLGFCFISTQ